MPPFLQANRFLRSLLPRGTARMCGMQRIACWLAPTPNRAYQESLSNVEDVVGRSQLETGSFMTPWPLVVAIMAPIAGSSSDRHSAGILGGPGLALLSLGMVLLAMLPAN